MATKGEEGAGCVFVVACFLFIGGADLIGQYMECRQLTTGIALLIVAAILLWMVLTKK